MGWNGAEPAPYAARQDRCQRCRHGSSVNRGKPIDVSLTPAPCRSDTVGRMENRIAALVPKQRYAAPVRYGASLAVVGLLFLIRVALTEALAHYPLLLFIPAIFLVALLFGHGAGYVATIASTLLAIFFFIAPRNSFTLTHQDILPLMLYVVIGFVMSAVIEALRRTVRRLADAEARASLLLEEMGHRTRNDLMMVSSVLSLQARGQQEPAVRKALESAVARVGVIASAQERLHASKNDNEGRVELSGYLTSLCSNLGDLLRDVRPIAVRVDAPTVNFPPSRAISVGLMVNELVTNAFKYAFPGDTGGSVIVTLVEDGPQLLITVEDDGVGCPVEEGGGTGSRLVRLLAANLGGHVKRIPVDKGCKVQVAIPAAPP